MASGQFHRSVVSDSATPWTAARQASLSITNSWSLLKLMSVEWVTPSNHLILCRPLLLPPSIFPSIRVFSNESVFHTSPTKILPSLVHSFVTENLHEIKKKQIPGCFKLLLPFISKTESSDMGIPFFIFKLFKSVQIIPGKTTELL